MRSGGSMSMTGSARRTWAVWGFVCLLAITGCVGVPRARLAAYRELAAWLQAHALPDETVAVQQRDAWARLTGHPLAALPGGSDALALLTSLQESLPDYCVVSRSVAWEGVQANAWFQERYRQVTVAATVDDAASPFALYRYRPSPFDAGDELLLERTLEDAAVGSLTLHSVRLSSWRLEPGEGVYAGLTLLGNLREPLTAVWRLRELDSGRIWAQEVRTQPGGAPTDAWPPDATISERYVVVSPPDLPPGDYALELAFIRPNRAPFGETILLATLLSPPDVSQMPPEVDHPLDIAVGDAVALVGYDAPAQLSQGTSLRIALHWHAQHPMPRGQKVFVHVFNPAQTLAAQADAIPVNWTYPTTAWQPGDYIRDVHIVPLDPDLPRGDYPVTVGMYDEATGERQPLRDANGVPVPDNAAPLYVLRIR
jgi:hypothetical protein